MYYLQSRYYDSELGRFISGDDVSALGANADFASFNLFAYCGNNSVARRDSSGAAWDTILDIAFVGIDIRNLATDGGWKNWKNWAALGVDLACTAIPFATGGGQIVKAGTTISDLSKVTVVGETMDRVRAVAETVNATENLYDGFKYYGKLSSKGVLGKTIAEVGGKLDNAAWLYGKLRTGYTIVDIGIDSSRATRSSSYMMESILLGFWKGKSIIKTGIKIWAGDE